ncbi:MULTISPECIES: HAMP domain-containing sensor histidine kinase [unclassified Nodularia (in: cyanobacteria)]|uniref:ATP-binding protein n=1 Tax=unclassified Nodularia (in: cyanobacteria) TaxID=2656917 RepID=UPI00188090BA|nr:HAMP domain-containing sensor histidine kinase [Nodularia sp. LEGE 06071]MBE9198463.1 HAMP domain-containing histidine kinase [Nodularia sp. LEGE 06071]MCC2691072.1 HAMP domain-containing histidine kinase [Nodularia sp. LEGE 04288]
MKQISQVFSRIDLHSLQVRLTVGIAVLSALGLGMLAAWTSWKMKEILVNSHKHNIARIAKRLPKDVQLYSEMLPSEVGLQKAIDNLTSTNTFLWIKSPENKVLAKSQNWNQLSDGAANELMLLQEKSFQPQINQVKQYYFIVCGAALPVEGKTLGNLFVVRDVTYEHTMFLVIVRSLGIGSVFVIAAISGAIALYIQRSLQPLRQLSRMTELISIEDVGQAQLYLDNAPSEVKELAQTCNMMLSRLSQSWEQEKQFVSNVSHELRTPLTIVQGYLQSVLRRQNNLTPTQIEALETAATEAEYTIRLLEDLLDLARADSGYLQFIREPCVLNDLVIEVVGMAEKYSDRQIQIDAIIEHIEVKADYNRLKQVLLNLIDNAVKYSEADTPVIVKLDRQKAEVIIQVCDQGYGIPLQQQTRIFERFYRIDEARTLSTGGCGLGLSIVKTLVEGMGGNVTVRSRLGEGSMFTINLPCD